MVRVYSPPTNCSRSLLRPDCTGTARHSSVTLAYMSSMRATCSSASRRLWCTVCPSCQRNSEVLRKGFVDFISARRAVFQKFSFSGRSRQDFIHLEYMWYATVSEVGRSASLSPNSASPEWVTQYTSGLNPSKCVFSRTRSDSGISTGRNAFRTPSCANLRSSAALSSSHTA